MVTKGGMSMVLASLLCIAFLQLLLCGCGEGGDPVVPAVFVFGDSLVDCGNNNYIPTIARSNYFPYGIDFGLPTGRFCNGLTVVDYEARFLGLPLTPPYLSPFSKGMNILRGLNYASAAAGILDETGKTYGARTTFYEQISQFETTTIDLKLLSFFENPGELSQYIAKSIFIISIGSNDYINNYLMPDRYSSSSIYNEEDYADLLINTFSTQISRLYDLGARKMVLAAVGPLGCIPSQLSMASDTKTGCVDQVNNLVTMYNSRLFQLVNTLNASLPGSFFVYQNTYGLFQDIIANSSRYGFLVTNRACCGNGRYGGNLTCLPLQQPCPNRDQYAFWDSFHPTEAVNKIIAESGFSEPAEFCYPISIYKLAQL